MIRNEDIRNEDFETSKSYRDSDPMRATTMVDIGPEGIIDEFEKVISSLESQIFHLGERLLPVRRPYPQQVTECDDPMPSVSHARYQLNRIHAATSRLVSLVEELEV